MDEATLKQATEPFFTTKGVGKGTGLGLSMVHGLAAQSGGAMRLMSRIGQGTTVELWFPVAGEQAHARAVVPQEARYVASRQCHVLVVDDDPLISASTAAMLEDAGHVVIEASSGVRALDVMRMGARIDIVVTDQAMPGMTGIDLAKQIRRTWPMLPIILASGYVDLPASEDVGLPRLAKPYSQAELLELMTRVLDGSPHSHNVIALGSARHG